MCVVSKLRPSSEPFGTSPLDGLLFADEDSDDDCKPTIIDPDPCYIHGYPPDLLPLLTTAVDSQNMSMTGDEPNLNGRLRPRKSTSKQHTYNTSRKSDDKASQGKPKKTRSPSNGPPKNSGLKNEAPKVSTTAKQPLKASTPAKEPPKASTPAKEPPKASTPAKEPPKASTPAKEPPKASTPAKEPPKASTPAKELPKTGTLSKELPKTPCVLSTEPPKTNNDLANKSDFSSTPQFLCSYCDKRFSSKKNFTKHVQRSHSTSPKQVTFVCLFCNHSEPDTTSIISHMIDDHPLQYFACLDCQTRFASSSELAEHKLIKCKKLKPNKKLRQKDPAGRKARKKTNKSQEPKDEVKNTSYELLQDGPSFNGIVISCELKSTQVHDNADIEDHISTNVILPPSKSLAETSGLDKGTVIVLDDVQWNKRMPPNFSFHNTDADQILSRLGVVHRSPRTGESSRRDFMKTIDSFPVKFEKCFETSFYSKVASNVQENLTKFLDGTFNFSPDPNKAIKPRKAKNSVVINTAEGFPILLASEQFTRSDLDCYMPRAIAPKHKWKWDNLDNDKAMLSVDQIKRDNHTNNCIITLVSSLDIWTQLCMRRKYEGKFGSKPVEKKTEKQIIIGNELKQILESREITSSSSPSQGVKCSPAVEMSGPVDELSFPLSLGLRPRIMAMTRVPVQPPAVLSGEYVRPRCFVCCACGDQTRDGRTLSLHIITHHPNAQVQHYEIVGEQLLNADILKHLYVPPSQVANRTRPLRGIKECTKCQKPISLEDLHQHMLDCAGDTPAVRRRQPRSRPFGVRRRRPRRPRLPDTTLRTRIRKSIRSKKRRQTKVGIARPKIRTEVGDGETIRKMLADLPAKRHRALVNPPLKRTRPRRMVNHLMIKRRVSEHVSAGHRRLDSRADKSSTSVSCTKHPTKPKTNVSSDKEDDDEEDNKPLKPKKHRLNNLRTRISIARKVALTKAKRRSLRVIQKSAINNDVPEPSTKPNVDNKIVENKKKEEEETTSKIQEPPAVSNPKKNDIIRGSYNTRQTANSGDSYSNYSRQPSGYNTRHQSGGNEGSSNNNSQQQDPGGGGYNTRQNSGYGDDYSQNSRSGGYNNRRPDGGNGSGDHPHNMTHGHGSVYSRSGYNTRERANRYGSNNRFSRNELPPPAPGPPYQERVAPLAPPGIPLKHSIARLTANSETHDKAVQFTHCFLVQQECNNTDQHAPSDPQPVVESGAMTQQVDKPPILYSDRSLLELCALQKNKLNKPKKGLNDCIAMLKNKLVEPMLTGHVSVQCGPDEPMSPMYLSSTIRPISKEAMMISPKLNDRDEETATVNIKAQNEHFNIPNEAEIQAQIHRDRLSFPPPRNRPPTASAVKTRRHSTEQTSRNRSSRQKSPWNNVPTPDITLVRRRTNSSSSDKRTTPTRESKPPAHRVSVSMNDPMYQSTVGEYHSELQLVLPKSIEVNKIKTPRSRTRSSIRSRRQSDALDYYYRKSATDFNWQNSYHSRALSDRSENISLTHYQYVQPVETMPPMHTPAYGHRSEKITATHHLPYEEEYEKIREMHNLHSEQTLVKISPSRNMTYDQTSDKITPMHNVSYDRMYDKIPVNHDPSYDQTIEQVPVIHDYSYEQGMESGYMESRSSSQKYAEAESVQYERIHDNRNIYPDGDALPAHASTNADSVIPSPLDLSGRVSDVSHEMPYSYDGNETLDLSRKSTERYDAPMIDDVVDLRVRTYSNNQEYDYYRTSTTTMLDPEAANDLSLRGERFQSLPTDLSLKYREKRDSIYSLRHKRNDVEVMSSQKRMKTRSENLRSGNLLIESIHSDTDTIKKLNETDQTSYAHKSKNVNDLTLSTNSLHTYQQVPKPTENDFSMVCLPRQTIEAKTIPKRRPSCTVTSQSLAQAAQEASYSNSSDTCANQTIANLESYIDTHKKMSEHVTSINAAKINETIFVSMDICNRGAPNITRPEHYKLAIKEKLSNKATAIDQDPETAKKIAMLPRELVEILGTMPVDHRNQLLNVLPQYVATTMASPLSLPDTETHTSAVIRSKQDDNDHEIVMPIIPLKIKASHLSRKSCEAVICDKRSNAFLTPSPPVFSETQFENTSVKSTITENITISPIIQTICKPNKNCTSLVTDSNIHQHDVQRTINNNESEDCNEAIKVARDLSLSIKMPLPEPVLVKVDKLSRPNNEQTASLRAVRIRAQTDRLKDNQPVKEIPAEDISQKITEEITLPILLESKSTTTNEILQSKVTKDSNPGLSFEAQLFLAVQQADISSTEHANKKKADLAMQKLVNASVSLTPVENTNKQQAILTKDREMINQPSPIKSNQVCVEDTILTETIPENLDSAMSEPNNVSLTFQEESTVLPVLEKNYTSSEGESTNFNKNVPAMSPKNESSIDKKEPISIDWPRHETTVQEDDSEDDVSLAVIVKLKQRDIPKKSKNSKKVEKSKFTKHIQPKKSFKATDNDKAIFLNDTETAEDFEEKINNASPTNQRSYFFEDEFNTKKADTNKPAEDNKSSLDNLSTLEPVSDEHLKQDFFRKTLKKKKYKKSAKCASKIKNEDAKIMSTKNESKSKENSSKVLQTSGGDVDTSFNSECSGSNKDSLGGGTLIVKDINSSSDMTLHPFAPVALQTNKDVTFESDKSSQNFVESIDPPIVDSDKILKTCIESVDPPTDKDKTPNTCLELINTPTNKDIRTGKKDNEKESVTSVYSSLVTAPVIFRDIQYTAVPLRRSRRGKSVFTDSSDSKLVELTTSPSIDLHSDHKPPVTKKQLIFSKLFLDEENQLNAIEQVFEPSRVNEEVPTTRNNSGCTSDQKNSSEKSFVASNKTIQASKSLKRKNKPQNQESKKKKSFDAASVPQKLEDLKKLSKETKPLTKNDTLDAKTSENDLSPASSLQDSQVAERDWIISIDGKQFSSSPEKRKQAIDDTVEPKTKKLKLGIQMQGHDLKSSQVNKTTKEDVEITHKLPCYSLQIAGRRTRSKSVNIKLCDKYDPYDIDLDDMIDYEPLKKSCKSHHIKISKLKSNNLELNLPALATFKNDNLAHAPGSVTTQNEQKYHQSESITINHEKIAQEPGEEKDVNVVFLKNKKYGYKHRKNISLVSQKDDPTLDSTQDFHDDVLKLREKHNERENIDSDDSSKSDVPLVKYIEDKEKKQLAASVLNNNAENKSNKLKKCNKDKVKSLVALSPSKDCLPVCVLPAKKSRKSLASLAKRQKKKQKKTLSKTLSSNNTDDEKSDVPLQKLIEDKKIQQNVAPTLNTIDDENNHIPLSILTKGKKNKVAAKPKGKALVVASCKIKTTNKKAKKSVQDVPSIQEPLKPDETTSKKETDEQLRSEKFMESFGFFSERKPRKSNLIAARKIAETFHNANESDAMFLKRMSRYTNPIENKVSTEKSHVKSSTKIISDKKATPKLEKTRKSRRRSCRPCQKRFSRADSLMRHRLTYLHASKLSQFQMKFRTRPAPEEPNFLIALKQQAKRFNVLLDPAKNKDNKQAKMPSLHNIVSEALRDVREQKMSLIGFTREEALFIDCCELLNSSEIAKLMKEVPHPNPNRMCLGKCNRPPKLRVKIKSNKKRKRHGKAKKKNIKTVMKVEKIHKTSIKDLSTASKTSMEYQAIPGPSSSLQRSKCNINADPSRQTETVGIGKFTESQLKHCLSQISKTIETITSDKGAESRSLPGPSNSSHKQTETTIGKRSAPQPTSVPSRILIPKTRTAGHRKVQNTKSKSDALKKFKNKNKLFGREIQPKPGTSNDKISEVNNTINESAKSPIPGKKIDKNIKTATFKKCKNSLLKSVLTKNSGGIIKKCKHNNVIKPSRTLKNVLEKNISKVTGDKCTENQSIKNGSDEKIKTMTSEKSDYQSKPPASYNLQRIKSPTKNKCKSSKKLVLAKKIFKNFTTDVCLKSVDIQPKPGPSKTTHQFNVNSVNESTESQQKPSENASFEFETETLPVDNDKCTLLEKERKSKITEIVMESQPKPVLSKSSNITSETPTTGKKVTGNQLKSIPTKNSCPKPETVNIDKYPDTPPKSIPSTSDKITDSLSNMNSSEVASPLKSSPSKDLRIKAEMVNAEKSSETADGADLSTNTIKKNKKDTHEGTEKASSENYPESQPKAGTSKKNLSKTASHIIQEDSKSTRIKPVSAYSKMARNKMETVTNEKSAENEANSVSFKNSHQKTGPVASDKCAKSQPEEPGPLKKSRQRRETVSAISEDRNLAQEISRHSTSSNTQAKENKNEKFKIKKFMYPEETVDLFEDKFDKIKRKCRSQAAAAKSIPVVEPITAQKSEPEECKMKNKKLETKSKKCCKIGIKAVPTKGALKGFDEVKMSIATSELDDFSARPSLESSTKKRKRKSNKKKQKKLLELNRKHESNECTKPQKKLDVYEFFDEETELLELRPSTLMERFKNIAKKDTSSTSKHSKETSSTAKQLKETSSTSKQLVQVSQDQEPDDSSNSMSDGDDFVYMSDDYVASDDETENSLISEIGIVKNDGKKAASQLKKKEVTEKNAVMGKIFKHNALRPEKKEKKVQCDVTEKPQANLDQLFDSLLNDIPIEETVPHQQDNPSPKVSSRSPSLSASMESFTEPKTRCLSPEIYDHPTPKKEIKPRLVASTTTKSSSVYDFDCVPSTSKKRDDFDLSHDFNTRSLIHTRTFAKENRDISFTKTYSSDDDDSNVFRASGSGTKKSSPVFERTETFIAVSDSNVEDAGVARQRARRKCTVGKQNVLAESWSSESDIEGGPLRRNSTETAVAGSNRKKKGRKGRSGMKCKHRQVSGNKQEAIRVANSSRSTSTSGAVVSGFVGNIDDVKGVAQASMSSSIPVVDKADVYNWDIEQEAEEQAQREREQHGWIVGGSHKKLVTMLAHAKGRKRNHDTHLLE